MCLNLLYIVNPMSATLKDAKNHKNPILEHGRSSSWNVFNSRYIFEIQKTPIFFINKALDPSLLIEKRRSVACRLQMPCFTMPQQKASCFKKNSTPLQLRNCLKLTSVFWPLEIHASVQMIPFLLFFFCWLMYFQMQKMLVSGRVMTLCQYIDRYKYI